MTDKKVEKKKTEKELKDAYFARVEHCMQNVEKWSAKLGRASHSRKYELSGPQRAFVLNFIAAQATKTSDAVKSEKRQVVELTRLPQ